MRKDKRVARSAFSLIEVLVAIALFGLATAALFSAVAPVHEALFRLSSSTRDAGDLEIAKAIAESSKDRNTLTQGGDAALPDGRSMAWRAVLEPTDVEALFLVHLTVDISGAGSLKSDYLRFDPRWLDPTAEKPRWLAHSGGNPGGGGQAGRPDRGDRGGAGQSGEGGQVGNQGRGGRGNREGGEPAGGGRQGGRGGARIAPPVGGGGR